MKPTKSIPELHWKIKNVDNWLSTFHRLCSYMLLHHHLIC